ncbi:DNA/RNA nuclease SfsA [Pseudoflavonifractor sp. 524-17]|uniref:DNA/RNA nuclease SfsA n=1 Tax=Pseudoflavonifractor sp. 524-17 TaxID=2304577 RepID=UPI00137A3BF4|nr:DNA/RNA nuclease SfsA [Pseudoflavonifractor sp. 524-17]NCE65021.1 DNA/RNA nuclease SfsA [Pseudoflavonifractor sp. 524-17]
MQYHSIKQARFLSRPNRFIAHVELNGAEEVVHVKNTGRCRELLVPGCTVYLEESANPDRKTKYDLVAADKSGLLINMDAQAPNKVFQEWALEGRFVQNLTLLRPERTFGSSRFDFYWEAGPDRRGFVEVKGVTLEEEGLVLFPDAPTQRGVKHLEELMSCRRAGYEAAVCFVVQMARAVHFSPNDCTHPAFGDALRRSAAAGVDLLAYTCKVAPDRLELDQPLPIQL